MLFICFFSGKIHVKNSEIFIFLQYYYVEKIYYYIKKSFLLVIRLFFVFLRNGSSCIVCGKKAWLYPVCGVCGKNHFSVQKAFLQKRCSVCGKSLLSAKGLCLECRSERVIFHVDYSMPLFSYRLWNRQIMYRWKKQEDRSLSFFFGKMIFQALQKMNVDAVVPVPPRPGKIGEKGWDQINDIAQFLKYECGIKVLNLLVRISDKEQKKKIRSERLQAISNAYQPCSKKRFDYILRQYGGKLPETVCIIDDVCTTGATLESCAIILKNMNIRRIFALTLFCVD